MKSWQKSVALQYARRAVACAALGVISAGCHREQKISATSFEMRDAWVRAIPDSGATTAAYLRLINGSPDTVVVSRFTSDDAKTVELHQTSIDKAGEATMEMRDSLVIAPSHIVVMAPGGYHLMMIGTKHPLVPGTMVRIVMHLSDGSIVSTSAKVKS